jgi:hypothetical protein
MTAADPPSASTAIPADTVMIDALSIPDNWLNQT